MEEKSYRLHNEEALKHIDGTNLFYIIEMKMGDARIIGLRHESGLIVRSGILRFIYTYDEEFFDVWKIKTIFATNSKDIAQDCLNLAWQDFMIKPYNDEFYTVFIDGVDIIRLENNSVSSAINKYKLI